MGGFNPAWCIGIGVGALLVAADFMMPAAWRIKLGVWCGTAGALFILIGFVGLARNALWLYADAPLTLTSESHSPAYPSDLVVHGIKWEDRFSELRVKVANNTPNDYSNLVVWIETDLGLSQLRPLYDSQPSYYAFGCSSFPDMQWKPNLRVISHWKDEQGRWHEREGTSPPSANNEAWAYRLACSKLPHDSELDLIGALFNQNLESYPPSGSPLYLPPKAARWVKLSATYDFRHSRTVNRTDCFSGQLGRSLSVRDCADSFAEPSIFRAEPAIIIRDLEHHRDALADRIMERAVGICAFLIIACPVALAVRWCFGLPCVAWQTAASDSDSAEKS